MTKQFIPARVFYEPSALDYPLGVSLVERFRKMGIPVSTTASHNRVTGIPGKSSTEIYREAKRTLVIGVRRSQTFQSCKPSAHYQLPLALNSSRIGLHLRQKPIFWKFFRTPFYQWLRTKESLNMDSLATENMSINLKKWRR